MVGASRSASKTAPVRFSLEYAMAAEALTSALTITPELMDATPALDMPISPEMATSAALPLESPTSIRPAVRSIRESLS